jgi:glyoxylase-like metal-dependent hydrolase (beta-lactamase superfamily II)
VLFFAPEQAKKRAGEWGPARLQERIAASWADFLARLREPARPWLEVVEGHGRQAVEATYAALRDGTLPANEGRILGV